MLVTIAFICCLLSSVISFFIHYEFLAFTQKYLPKHFTHRLQLVLTVMVIFFAHILEVLFYAVIYDVSINYLGLGEIRGEFDGSMVDLFYFSAGTYTSLGLGDIFPAGLVRLIVGTEALLGLVLIGWSATFTYRQLQRNEPA